MPCACWVSGLSCTRVAPASVVQGSLGGSGQELGTYMRPLPRRREYVVDAPPGLADGGAPVLTLAQRRRRAVYYSAPAAAAPRSRCFSWPHTASVVVGKPLGV